MSGSRTGWDCWKAAIAAVAIYGLVLNALLMGVMMAPGAMAPGAQARTLDQILSSPAFVCRTASSSETAPGLPGQPPQHQSDCCVLCDGAACAMGLPAAAVHQPAPAPILLAQASIVPTLPAPPAIFRVAAQPRGPPAH